MSIVIYGGNMSGIVAAVEAGRRGVLVTLIEPTNFLGTMWATGLGQTDRETGNVSMRWGILSEIETKAGTNAGTGPLLFPTMDNINSIITSLLSGVSSFVTVVKNKPLESVNKTVRADGQAVINSIVCGGTTYAGTNFIDATDEGDLAAMAGCLMRVGRESVAVTGEPTSGVRPPNLETPKAYNPATGERLNRIYPAPVQKPGDSDWRTMAYNMRVIVTNHASRINWADINLGFTPNPEDYRQDLELAVSNNLIKIPGSIGRVEDGLLPIVGGVKTSDMNNGGLLPIGTNEVGFFHDWLNWNWAQRNAKVIEYAQYKLGLFKVICTDAEWLSRRPALVADTKLWGLVPGLFDFPVWASGQTLGLGAQKFKVPFIYEVTSVTDPDGFVITTAAPAAWAASTVYKVGDKRTNGTGRYEVTAVPVPPETIPPTPATGTSASSGGPTGKDPAITDGTVTWKYAGLANPTATTGSTGPVGSGTNLSDGSNLKWKSVQLFFPGMSPAIYVRIGRAIVGQVERRFKDVLSPINNTVKEPVTGYGYHFDAHWVERYAHSSGVIAFEGGAGLDGGFSDVPSLMPFGALKARKNDARNLMVSRAISGTYMGKINARVELSYIKFGQVGGMAAALADLDGMHTSDIDYATRLLPALVERGAILTVQE
jgi:hypothetical protein